MKMHGFLIGSWASDESCDSFLSFYDAINNTKKGQRGPNTIKPRILRTPRTNTWGFRDRLKTQEFRGVYPSI